MTHEQHKPHVQHSYRLTHGPYAAEILAAGATLSRLTHANRDLIAPADGPHAPGFAGALLAPWPNRVVDGRFKFAGVVHELEINEPARNHAIHGLAHALEFTPAKPHTADTLELIATLEPSPGYPWRLQFTAHFALDDAGLSYGITTENLSGTAAPFGASTHPYLIAGTGPVDEWTLELSVDERLDVAPDRLIPQHLTAWGGFAGPGPAGTLGDARHDHAFTSISWGDGNATGRAIARVVAPEGTGVELSWDRACPWVQVFTTDLGEGQPWNRRALAVEPMTCAPDAFNAAAYPFDAGLLSLAPGTPFDVSWRLRAV